MPRRIQIVWWTAATLALLGIATIGTRRHLRSTVTACLGSQLVCEEAKRVARPLCWFRFPGACRGLDDIYGAEFRYAESLYRSCGEDETYACVNAQRFRDEPDRRRTAGAARRLCEHNNESACVMLALYYRDGLGVLQDRESAARTFEIACNLGAERYCERAASMYVEQAARLSHRSRLAEMKVEADRRADRGTPDVQSFYVLGAKLSEVKPLQPNGLDHELLRQGGQEYDPNSLVPGTSLVLSIRTFYPGAAMIVDDEAFEKLSMEIPSLRVGVPVDLAAGDVRVYYAEGSSSWSATAGNAFAKQAQGTVTILSVDEARGVLKAHLDLVAQPHFADCRKPSADPEAKEVHGEFSFARKKLDELSAWLGGKKTGLRNFP